MNDINKFTEAKKKKRKVKVTYSTGYPAYDIKMFNRRFDGMSNGSWEVEANKDLGNINAVSPDGSSVFDGGETAGGEGMSENMTLSEAKRYVRRYYIRPIN